MYSCYRSYSPGIVSPKVQLFSLSTMATCTAVTGLRNKTNREFQNHLKELCTVIADVKYDKQAGNPGMSNVIFKCIWFYLFFNWF